MSEICETLLKKDFSGAGSGWKAQSARTEKGGVMGQGSELVPGGRISLYLKKDSLGGPSWSQKARSARTSKTVVSKGSELVPGGRISSHGTATKIL